MHRVRCTTGSAGRGTLEQIRSRCSLCSTVGHEQSSPWEWHTHHAVDAEGSTDDSAPTDDEAAEGARDGASDSASDGRGHDESSGPRSSEREDCNSDDADGQGSILGGTDGSELFSQWASSASNRQRAERSQRARQMRHGQQQQTAAQRGRRYARHRMDRVAAATHAERIRQRNEETVTDREMVRTCIAHAAADAPSLRIDGR